MELTFKEKLKKSLIEFKDTKIILDIEIANCISESVKAQLLETKYKILVAIVNIEKDISKLY